MARKRPDESMNERAEKFVADAQVEYTDALAEVRAAAEMTATPAWQATYQHQREAHRKLIATHAKSIISTCEAVSDHDSNETDEKAVRDQLKSIIEERIRFEAWTARAVFPISSRVNRCEEIVNKLKLSARRTEDEEMLVSHGLHSAVCDILATWPTANWDEKTGIVSVIEPESQANSATA